MKHMNNHKAAKQTTPQAKAVTDGPKLPIGVRYINVRIPIVDDTDPHVDKEYGMPPVTFRLNDAPASAFLRFVLAMERLDNASGVMARSKADSLRYLFQQVAAAILQK